MALTSSNEDYPQNFGRAEKSAVKFAETLHIKILDQLVEIYSITDGYTSEEIGQMYKDKDACIVDEYNQLLDWYMTMLKERVIDTKL